MEILIKGLNEAEARNLVENLRIMNVSATRDEKPQLLMVTYEEKDSIILNKIED